MPSICCFLVFFKGGFMAGKFTTTPHYFLSESIWRFKEAVETSDICPLSTCHCDIWEVVRSRFFDLFIEFFMVNVPTKSTQVFLFRYCI